MHKVERQSDVKYSSTLLRNLFCLVKFRKQTIPEDFQILPIWPNAYTGSAKPSFAVVLPSIYFCVIRSHIINDTRRWRKILLLNTNITSDICTMGQITYHQTCIAGQKRKNAHTISKLLESFTTRSSFWHLEEHVRVMEHNDNCDISNG